MKKSFTIIVLSMLMLSLQSCKKESAGTSCSLNNQSLSGEWIITAATYKASSTSPVIDEYVEWSFCQKDDLYVIDADGTISIERRPSCGSPDPGDYLLNGNSINVLFDSGYEFSGIISDFDCLTFKLVDKDVVTGETYTLSFKKQQ